MNQYEWSIATPRSNCSWALALQEVGKLTLPNFSCAAATLMHDSKTRLSNEKALAIIITSLLTVVSFCEKENSSVLECRRTYCQSSCSVQEFIGGSIHPEQSPRSSKLEPEL